MKKVLLIDNYDSFTWNLYHLIRSCGDASVRCRKSDAFCDEDVREADAIVLSPGPGKPEEMPGLMPLIRFYHLQKPILGICLGHQAIGRFFGAGMKRLERPQHGARHLVYRTAQKSEALEAMPRSFMVGRYHSWILDETDWPDCLQVTARDESGNVMAISHRELPLEGLQFHPESYMCDAGREILAAFLCLQPNSV